MTVETMRREEKPASQARPGCPACGGTLVPLRGQVRCARCQWTMCAGCEPVPDILPEEDEGLLRVRG